MGANPFDSEHGPAVPIRGRPEMPDRPADPLAVLREACVALAAVERLVEAARPMANLPYPLSADERQQWLIRQNQLRDALALSEQDECLYDDPCLAADSQPEETA